MMSETDLNLPGINPDLIRQYADQYKLGDLSGLTNLITIFNSLRRGEIQARTLSQAYLNQISRMHRDGFKTEPRKTDFDSRRISNVQSERTTHREAQAKGQVPSRLAQGESKAPAAPQPKREKITLDLDL